MKTSIKKTVVLFNWRDLAHPRAGGAEAYTHDLLCELSELGFDCIWFCSAATGLPREEAKPEYRVVRRGNEITCRLHGARWLFKHRESITVVIDEVNTLPFLSRLVVGEKVALLQHQLAREVWWKEAPAPLAPVGYAMEPLFLQIYRGCPVITISQSSLRSLKSVGLAKRSFVIEPPLQEAVGLPLHYVPGRVGFVGRVTPSKRVDDSIRAFAAARTHAPDADLFIIGAGHPRYIEDLRVLASTLGVKDAVHFTGRVSSQERDALVSSLDCLVLASMREGWGLVVSEAARFSVPTVAYDVPGLRDSIVDGETGLLARSGDWKMLGSQMAKLLRNRALRDRLGKSAAELLRKYSRDVFRSKVREAAEALVGSPLTEA